MIATNIRARHHNLLAPVAWLESDAGQRWAEVLTQLGVPQRHLLRLHPIIMQAPVGLATVEGQLHAASRRIWRAVENGAAAPGLIERERAALPPLEFSRSVRRTGWWVRALATERGR